MAEWVMWLAAALNLGCGGWFLWASAAERSRTWSIARNANTALNTAVSYAQAGYCAFVACNETRYDVCAKPADHTCVRASVEQLLEEVKQ